MRGAGWLRLWHRLGDRRVARRLPGNHQLHLGLQPARGGGQRGLQDRVQRLDEVCTWPVVRLDLANCDRTACLSPAGRASELLLRLVGCMATSPPTTRLRSDRNLREITRRATYRLRVGVQPRPRRATCTFESHVTALQFYDTGSLCDRPTTCNGAPSAASPPQPSPRPLPEGRVPSRMLAPLPPRGWSEGTLRRRSAVIRPSCSIGYRGVAHGFLSRPFSARGTDRMPSAPSCRRPWPWPWLRWRGPPTAACRAPACWPPWPAQQPACRRRVCDAEPTRCHAALHGAALFPCRSRTSSPRLRVQQRSTARRGSGVAARGVRACGAVAGGAALAAAVSRARRWPAAVVLRRGRPSSRRPVRLALGAAHEGAPEHAAARRASSLIIFLLAATRRCAHTADEASPPHAVSLASRSASVAH